MVIVLSKHCPVLSRLMSKSHPKANVQCALKGFTVALTVKNYFDFYQLAHSFSIDIGLNSFRKLSYQCQDERITLRQNLPTTNFLLEELMHLQPTLISMCPFTPSLGMQQKVSLSSKQNVKKCMLTGYIRILNFTVICICSPPALAFRTIYDYRKPCICHILWLLELK